MLNAIFEVFLVGKLRMEGPLFSANVHKRTDGYLLNELCEESWQRKQRKETQDQK
jgi:hypothetical protein